LNSNYFKFTLNKRASSFNSFHVEWKSNDEGRDILATAAYDSRQELLIRGNIHSVCK